MDRSSQCLKNFHFPKVCVKVTQVPRAPYVRDMASTLPAGLYDDIMSTAGSLVPYTLTYSECNVKSFVGHCNLKGMDCHIRVSSEYTGIRYFLTLTHEIAHAITWSKYGFDKKKIKPHGKEWKDEYRSFVLRFMGKGYFSVDLEHAINVHMLNPPFDAKIHSEIQKVLNPGQIPVGEVNYDCKFRFLNSEQVYKKLDKQYSKVTVMTVENHTLYTVHKNTMIVRVF